MKTTQVSYTKRMVMVALLAGSGLIAASSFAMPTGAPAGKGDCTHQHDKKTQAERTEMRTQKMAVLKANLKLSPQQEAAWNDFVGQRQAQMQQGGVDRKAKHAEFAAMTTPQRLDKMLEMSEMRREKMVARAEATKAFYAQLSPAQQSVFDAQAKTYRHRGHGSHQS